MVDIPPEGLSGEVSKRLRLSFRHNDKEDGDCIVVWKYAEKKSLL